MLSNAGDMQPPSKPAVLVTGCSSGIGLETVRRLSTRGYDVVGAVRNEQDFGVVTASGKNVAAIRMDVTDQKSIEDAVAQASGSGIGQRLVAIVNNAGIAVAGPVERVSPQRWHRQFDVNVLGMVRVTQAFLPLLRQSRGRVINVSSAASSLALPMVGAYASSKFAVEGLSDSLRRELVGSGVRVIIVCPGQTDTPIFDKTERETVDALDGNAETEDPIYGQKLSRFRELMHASEGGRRSPERVARVIVRSIESRWPRRRYHVGWDAKGAILVRNLVPVAFVDWVISRKIS